MNFFKNIGDSVTRLLDSENDEVLVFLVILLFVFLGRSGQRDSPDPEEAERFDSGGGIIFLVVFVAALLLTGNRETNNLLNS